MANSDKIKWINEVAKTGAFTVDISLYNVNYTLLGFIITYNSGVSTTMKIGLTLGGEEVMFSTDISFITGSRFIELNRCFKALETILYCDVNGGNFDIDYVFAQRIGA